MKCCFWSSSDFLPKVLAGSSGVFSNTDMKGRAQSWRSMSFEAKAFVCLVVTAGLVVLGYGMGHPSSKNIAEFICYLLVAFLASTLSVNLPEVSDTMSANCVLVLVGILELSFTETLALGSVAVLTQTFRRDRKRPMTLAVNLCTSACAIGLSYNFYHSEYIPRIFDNSVVWLLLAASVYFLANTGLVATASAVLERKSLQKIWVDCYSWSFPYYLVGAGVAALIGWIDIKYQWQSSLLVLPVIYLIYRSYHLYLSRLEDKKTHGEEMAGLHLRTIEALALAIEAKDHTTHDHLQRVRVYAIEIAKDMKVNQGELEALHAASLLHDIGKLAVPEHIISKPGRLTPEEFEKMKIHPVVGAEILERVRFPYPVVPIIRAHHEKWDGSGYPYGLKGEQIPIGARILTAVDFLDALSSDRHYRRALPLDEAMAILVKESGKAFDPQVVEVLKRRYKQLDQLARNNPMEPWRLSTDIQIEKGAAPAAGFAESGARQESAAAVDVSHLAPLRQLLEAVNSGERFLTFGE